MARDLFSHYRGWKLKKKEKNVIAEWAGIRSKKKEVKATGVPGPLVGFVNKTCGRVVYPCLPGTSTFPRRDNSLDFQGAGMDLANMLPGYFRELSPEIQKKKFTHTWGLLWQLAATPLVHYVRPCFSPCQLPTSLSRYNCQGGWDMPLFSTIWLFQETKIYDA